MKASIQQSFKSAFPKTIPIIPGYIFLGIAFGILLTNQGYAWYWPLIMAVVIFSGMAQFVTVNMLAPGISLINMPAMYFTVFLYWKNLKLWVSFAPI